MNNSKALQEARARKQYLQTELAKIDSEINKLYLLSDEYILSRDFDGDGIVSYIDQKILQDSAFGANNSQLYNSTNKTYNGKSLDLNGDGNISNSDSITFLYNVWNYIKEILPVDIVCNINPYNDKSGFNPNNWVNSYKNSHNGEYPILDELKAAYNAA